MLTYLFDASAAIEVYISQSESVKKVVRYVLDQKMVHRQAALFIPNFCVAEVFNTLARKHFDPGDDPQVLNDLEYKRHLDKFRRHVHWGETLYPYDLNRYHIIAADKIIPAEHSLARKHKHDHLSTFDILIIAMACELGYVWGRENTYLLTCDRRMKRVLEDLKVHDHGELMISGPLGELDAKRWVPPNCLFLPEVRTGELKSVPGQPHLNLS